MEEEWKGKNGKGYSPNVLYDYSKICRTCLTESTSLQNLFDSTLLEILQSLTDIKVNYII